MAVRIMTEHVGYAPPFGRLAAATNVAGSVALYVVGLAILAAVILLPPYADLLEAEYHRGCLAASVADTEAWIAATEQLIDDLPEDDVLTVRLARRQAGWLPRDEVVVPGSCPDEAAPAALVTISRQPRPEPPKGWAIELAAGLRAGTARRVLAVIAAPVMLAGMFLPGCPHRRSAAVPPEQPRDGR